MQKLKPEIKEKILAVAEELFFRQGYENATTREIAVKTGISVSNLYKYFENKEDIFDEIVKSFHSEYLSNFKSFINHNEPDSFDKNQEEVLSMALFNSIKINPVKFVILMDKSSGTRYRNFKKEICTGLEKHIRKEIEVQSANSFMLKILIENFLRGVVETAKNYQGDKWAYDNIKLLAKYHLAGMAALYK